MKIRIPLSSRFMILLIAILAAQTFATYWVASDRIKENIIEEKLNEMQLLLDTFHHSYESIRQHKNALASHELLELLTKDASIESAVVTDLQGQIIDSLTETDINKAFANTKEGSEFPYLPSRFKEVSQTKRALIWYDKSRERVHAISPIEFADYVTGTIYIRANLLDTEQIAINRLINALIPFALLITLTGIFATWYFHRFINQRIEELRKGTAIFTDEGRIAISEADENDELSDLQLSIRRLMTQVKDQTKLEQAIQSSKQKSRELEQKLSLHLKGTPMGVIEWDNEFKVTSWNPAASNIFGFTEEEAMGQHASFIVPEEAKAYVDALWNELFTTNKPTNSSNRNITKDGRSLVCDWVNTPLITENHRVIGVASFVMDKTSEHEAIKSLVKREQEQSDVLNSMTNGVITIDESGTIKSFNKAAEALFGYSAHELLDRNVKELMPMEIANHHDGYLKNYVRGRPSRIIGKGREVTALTKSGELLPIHLSVSELPAGSDGVKRFIGNCHDLRNEKQQEEMLRRSQKMDSLGKLTGGIAHDFNNILGVVTGYADILLSKLKGQDSLEKYAKEIKLASDRGTKLTRKLLASSKKKNAYSERTDINKVLLNQKDMMMKTLLPNIKLIYQTQDDLWPVMVDSDDLEDAILNLCINAMHAMPEGGKLCLLTYNTIINDAMAETMNVAAGDYVALCITDTGMGMDTPTREKIFDPFFTTKGDKGTGLGLSQVFGFIERSKAAIKVDSAISQGSQFSIFFPRLKELTPSSISSSERQHDKPQKSPSPKGKESILVVDDEEALRNLCAEILDEHGYQIHIAGSGEEALKLLNDNEYDLLLSDIMMPGMDGYELAEKAKTLRPEMKIQLASGYDPSQHQGYGNETLRQNIIAKPYTPFILLKQIRYTLDQG